MVLSKGGGDLGVLNFPKCVLLALKRSFFTKRVLNIPGVGGSPVWYLVLKLTIFYLHVLLVDVVSKVGELSQAVRTLARRGSAGDNKSKCQTIKIIFV